MWSEEVKESSQVVIVWPDNELFFELNKKQWWKISFFWWWKERNESSVETIIREIKQELWLDFTESDFMYLEDDWPRKFQKWTFLAHIFVLKISQEISNLLENNGKTNDWNKILKYTLVKLEQEENLEFSIWKQETIDRVEKALELV